MKKSFLISTAVAGLFLSVISANAEDVEIKKVYVGIKSGVFIPNTDGNSYKREGGLYKFDTGYNIELVGGIRFNKYLALETGVGVYATELKERFRTGDSATTVVVPVTLSAIAILPIQKFDIYAGAGLGYYTAQLKSDTTDTSSGELGYQVFGGVDFNITPNIAVGGEVRFTEAKPEFSFTPVNDLKVNVGGTILNGAFKYRF